MSERASFLNRSYGAYHHRERPPEDEELTRVGPGTPCGEYLRRFWQPVILASELGRRCRDGCASSARTSSPFATEAARSACWNCIARIAAPRSNSA